MQWTACADKSDCGKETPGLRYPGLLRSLRVINKRNGPMTIVALPRGGGTGSLPPPEMPRPQAR